MPQPIDLQTEVVRVLAAERVQQVADRQSLAAMQRVAADAQDRRVAAETQVQQTDPKGERVDRELRRRNPYAGRKRRRPGDDASQQDAVPKDNEVAPPPVMSERHQLDVTV